MQRPRRPHAVAHATRQRAVGVMSLVAVLGLYAAVLLTPVVGPALADVSPAEALRTVALGGTLLLGLLGLAVLR